MNSSTGYGTKKHNPVGYTEKRYSISTNRYLREDNVLPDGVEIDGMLPASAPNQYAKMEYKNEHHNLQSNGNISTSNTSSLSTLTSPSVTSTNG